MDNNEVDKDNDIFLPKMQYFEFIQKMMVAASITVLINARIDVCLRWKILHWLKEAEIERNKEEGDKDR